VPYLPLEQFFLTFSAGFVVHASAKEALSRVARAFDAMMDMKKIDVAAIKAARHG
jgi:hypothetical protein